MTDRMSHDEQKVLATARVEEWKVSYPDAWYIVGDWAWDIADETAGTIARIAFAWAAHLHMADAMGTPIGHYCAADYDITFGGDGTPAPEDLEMAGDIFGPYADGLPGDEIHALLLAMGQLYEDIGGAP